MAIVLREPARLGRARSSFQQTLYVRPFLTQDVLVPGEVIPTAVADVPDRLEPGVRENAPSKPNPALFERRLIADFPFQGLQRLDLGPIALQTAMVQAMGLDEEDPLLACPPMLDPQDEVRLETTAPEETHADARQLPQEAQLSVPIPCLGVMGLPELPKVTDELLFLRAERGR